MPRALALLLACLLAAPPAAAQGPVRRCMGPDGRPVFTDHRCEDLGAVERVRGARPAGNSLDPGPRLYSRGCPRTLSALVGELGAAIQSGDVNRLSAIYNWTGTSTASARRILDRLEAIVARPLVDIAPVMPAEPEPLAAVPAAAGSQDLAATPPAVEAWMPSWRLQPARPGGGQTAAAGGDTPAADAAPPPPPPPRRPRPVGLRVEQTLANGSTPSRTVFGLRRSYGCFWLALD